ncbi:hypothetical protein MN608_11155 [Microdochium nivale]|nr:hypothetical protein MN608_11155 [Microdochium nivale]
MVLGLPDDTTRDYLELSQVMTYMATGDYGPLLEYLDLVADDARFPASSPGGQDVEAAQQNAVRKARLLNCKAVCGLMSRDFSLAQRYLDGAHKTATATTTATTAQDSPSVAAVLFVTCRVQIALYRKTLADGNGEDGRASTSGRLLGTQTTARPYHEVLATALKLGYSHAGVSPAGEVYARNGALLSLLLESALPIPDSAPDAARGRGPLVTPVQLRELLGRLLPGGDLPPTGFLLQLETLLEISGLNSSSDEADDRDEGAARLVLQDAEVHMMQHHGNQRRGNAHHCHCRFDTARSIYDQHRHRQQGQRTDGGDQDTETAAVLGRIAPLLPRFRGLEVQLDMPWSSSIRVLLHAWTEHVVQNLHEPGWRVGQPEFDGGDVLQYLSEWHDEMARVGEGR